MRRIATSGEHEIEVKRSRFLCALARVDDETEAREFIATRRRLHYTARHHCSAYVLGAHGETQRSNDDGEPAGTAGIPMLEVLRRRELTGLVAVVTRYFGGVKLGASGLIRAYGSAVSQAVDAVGAVELQLVRTAHVEVSHAEAGKLDNELRAAGYPITDVRYADRVLFTVHIPSGGEAAFDAWLAESTGGSANAAYGDHEHVEVAVDFHSDEW